MDPKKIYIWVSNGIGNLIQMTPSIEACKRMGYSIHAGVDTTYNRHRPLLDILSRSEFIDRVVRFPSDHFDPGEYSHLVYFRTQEKSPVTKIIEDHKDGLVYDIPNWRVSKSHETWYFMQLPYDLGYRGKTPKLYCPVDNDFLVPREKIISIAPGCLSSPEWTKKKWDGKKWSQLIQSILFFYDDIHLYILGGSGEREESEEILSRVSYGSDRIHNYTGELNILQTSKILSSSLMTISVDSGLSHIAAAVGSYLIVIFGPTLISKNKPFTDKISVISMDMDCSPCQGTKLFKECRDNICMKMVDVGDVFNEIRSSGVIAI